MNPSITVISSQIQNIKQPCKAVRRNGKCIGGKNSIMLVEFADGDQVVIMARILRKIKL